MFHTLPQPTLLAAEALSRFLRECADGDAKPALPCPPDDPPPVRGSPSLHSAHPPLAGLLAECQPKPVRVARAGTARTPGTPAGARYVSPPLICWMSSRCSVQGWPCEPPFTTGPSLPSLGLPNTRSSGIRCRLPCPHPVSFILWQTWQNTLTCVLPFAAAGVTPSSVRASSAPPPTAPVLSWRAAAGPSGQRLPACRRLTPTAHPCALTGSRRSGRCFCACAQAT